MKERTVIFVILYKIYGRLYIVDLLYKTVDAADKTPDIATYIMMTFSFGISRLIHFSWAYIERANSLTVSCYRGLSNEMDEKVKRTVVKFYRYQMIK